MGLGRNFLAGQIDSDLGDFDLPLQCGGAGHLPRLSVSLSLAHYFGLISGVGFGMQVLGNVGGL